MQLKSLGLFENSPGGGAGPWRWSGLVADTDRPPPAQAPTNQPRGLPTRI